MPDLPKSTPVLIIGAGVHGLSTAWHVARNGGTPLVIDKTASAPARQGSHAGSSATTTSSPRCRS